MTEVTKNPFPGLRSFDYEESYLFFGREQHIGDLLNKLSQNHFVAIVGTSGTGKSSLVRAGLLPAIHQGKMQDSKKAWCIASMKPGNTPVKNLAAALIRKNILGTGDPEKDQPLLERMNQQMRASSLGLVQGVRNLLPPDTNLLILLDQFEETFRFSNDSMERNDTESENFVRLITDAVRQRDVPIYVVLTIRSDFLGDCVRFEGLPEAINDGHYLVPRLNEKQSKLVITGPVQYAGGKISPRLVQQVFNDLGDNPDQLPVLQHALMRTWDKWVETAEPGEPMDIRHYEMTGTMQHALSYHADEAFHELKTEKQKKLLEAVLKCLTVKTGENRGIRRPTAIKSLMQITGATYEELMQVMYPFRKAGRTFVLPGEEVAVSETTILDISHESLMRGWERLRTWVDEEMESAEMYNRLCNGAGLYKAGQSALWRDPELQVALDWKRKNNPNEAWAGQYNSQFGEAMRFLDESNAERGREIQRKKQRTLIIRGAVATFLVTVSILTAWALVQTKKATDKSHVAEQKTTEALNQKQLAEKAKEMALEASRQAMDAKSFAELQSNIAGEQKKLADQQKIKAEEEALRATQQQQLALEQKKLAEQKSAEALSQKMKADSATSEKERLRLVSISQNIAFKSLQEKNDAQLAGLLAYQAYKISDANGGNMNDAQLYNALITSAQKIDVSYKPMVIRENDDINAMALSGKTITALLKSNSVKNFGAENYAAGNQNRLSGLTSGGNTYYLSENAGFAAIGMDNNAVAVFDLRNTSQPKILAGHDGLIRAVAFSSDGATIVTGGRDSSLIIWKNNSLFKKNKCSSKVRAIAMSENNSRIFAGSEDGKVIQMNADGSDVQSFTAANGRVQAITCNGKLIAVGYSNGTVQLLNGSGQTVRSINEPASADFICLNERNDLLVIGLSNKLIHIHRLSESGKPIEINNTSVVTSLGMNSDFIYAACADNGIRCYPVKTSYFEKIFSQNLKRSFTREEWNTFIGGDVPYDK